MREPKLDDFDWVTARHDWNAERMMEILKRQAQTSVDTRNAQLPGDLAEFRCHDYERQGFSVQRQVTGHRAVDFTVVDARTLRVKPDGADEILIFPVIDEDGFNVCRIGDADLRPWQALRRVCETFLFE